MRRRGSAGGGGGGGVNEALAATATATTTAVMEAAENKVAVNVGRLKSSMQNARHEGGGTVPVVQFGIRICIPPLLA